jgi:hypothetical protein
MNDSFAGFFGNLFIVAALVLVVFGLSDRGAATAVVGVGLLVSGCLLRIEAAILRGQPSAPDPPRRDGGRAWRRSDAGVLHLPERADDTRPWHEPEEQTGPEPRS